MGDRSGPRPFREPSFSSTNSPSPAPFPSFCNTPPHQPVTATPLPPPSASRSTRRRRRGRIEEIKAVNLPSGELVLPPEVDLEDVRLILSGRLQSFALNIIQQIREVNDTSLRTLPPEKKVRREEGDGSSPPPSQERSRTRQLFQRLKFLVLATKRLKEVLKSWRRTKAKTEKTKSEYNTLEKTEKEEKYPIQPTVSSPTSFASSSSTSSLSTLQHRPSSSSLVWPVSPTPYEDGLRKTDFSNDKDDDFNYDDDDVVCKHPLWIAVCSLCFKAVCKHQHASKLKKCKDCYLLFAGDMQSSSTPGAVYSSTTIQINNNVTNHFHGTVIHGGTVHFHAVKSPKKSKFRKG